MKKSIIVTLMPLLFICATMNEARAEDSVFTVTSFIPERFRDFEWRVEGSGSTRRVEDNTWKTLQYDNAWNMQDNRSEQSIGNLRLMSSSKYYFYSLQRYYSLSLLSEFSVNENSTLQRSEELSDELFRYVSNGRHQQTEYQVKLGPGITGGSYLLGDLYVELGLAGDLYFSIMRGLKSSRESEWTRENYPDTNHIWKRRSTSEVSGKAHYTRLAVQAGAKVGWGRLYDAQFASTAMYIIDELRKAGLLDREPDKEQMLSLCSIIYENRLKHIIDSRVRQIESIEEIIAFLKGEELTSNEKPRDYLLIQDVWQYFPNSTRYFGWRVQVGTRGWYSKSGSTWKEDRVAIDTTIIYHSDSTGIADSIATRYDESKYKSENSDESSTGILFVDAEYHRPLDLRWQMAIRASSGYFRSEWFGANHGPTLVEDVMVQASSELGYTIDSRSLLSFHTAFQYRYLSEGKDTTTHRWSLSPSLNLEYRLAIPTTLKASVGYRYQEDEKEVKQTGDHHNLSKLELSASISHYLF